MRSGARRTHSVMAFLSKCDINVPLIHRSLLYGARLCADLTHRGALLHVHGARPCQHCIDYVTAVATARLSLGHTLYTAPAQSLLDCRHCVHAGDCRHQVRVPGTAKLYHKVGSTIECNTLQFKFWPWNSAQSGISSPHSPTALLGVHATESFANWDVVLLIALFFHRYVLRVS